MTTKTTMATKRWARLTNDLDPMMHKWYDSRSQERLFNDNVSVPSDDRETMESANVTMNALTKRRNDGTVERYDKDVNVRTNDEATESFHFQVN